MQNMQNMQKENFTIERREYLNWLITWRERQIIKVVSGVRRCGKSTLFELYRGHLLESGVDARQIHMLNFEDVTFEELTHYRKMYDYVTSKLLAGRMNYIFLDEIQRVGQFEKAVDSLFLKKNCDVYITGSNAYFMSGELATLLSGRYVELKMLPLSFREFTAGLKAQGRALPSNEAFTLYMNQSSFPYLLRFPSAQAEALDYLRGIYDTVLLKDVVTRLRIPDVNVLENVTKFMLHNVGNKVSPTKIANTLKSKGRGVDQKTVDRYLRGLTDSLMLYEASRYNIKGRQYLTTQSKYYVVDVALRNALVRGHDDDAGHLLENVVYLELLRRGFRVSAGMLDDGGEVDFVAEKAGSVVYCQVAATALDEDVLRRELAPLRRLLDNYPKYLLTLDETFGNANYDGILKRNVLDWLLNDGGL
ncbi:MAG: ATP-binding protein [Synergistaceae bacterium]|nr:ATP-binding protein [Synergistaceae bacterium]